MSSELQVNLDTSILFNYVYSSLPGDIEYDRGSQQLIDSDDYHTVIGGKAKSEFLAGCERRLELYDDVIQFLLTSNNDIYDYNPRNRPVEISPNDETHFRDGIQMSWYDKDKREQLSTLRRCHQDLGQYQMRLPRDLIDQCYPQQENNALLSRLQNDLEIAHDCDIIVDAAEICRNYAINTLIALDEDITDPAHIEQINSAITDIIGTSYIIEIAEPAEI